VFSADQLCRRRRPSPRFLVSSLVLRLLDVMTTVVGSVKADGRPASAKTRQPTEELWPANLVQERPFMN
jgi:hypothetical protein